MRLPALGTLFPICAGSLLARNYRLDSCKTTITLPGATSVYAVHRGSSRAQLAWRAIALSSIAIAVLALAGMLVTDRLFDLLLRREYLREVCIGCGKICRQAASPVGVAWRVGITGGLPSYCAAIVTWPAGVDELSSRVGETVASDQSARPVALREVLHERLMLPSKDLRSEYQLVCQWFFGGFWRIS
jgi:hypothetical protein